MKPLQLTSTTHAFAYGVYSKQTGFGICLLLGFASVRALADLMFVPIIGLALFLGGATGLYAITTAARAPNPEPGLRLERVAAYVIGVTNFFLACALFWKYGFTAGALAQIYVLGVAIPCGFRIRQIQHDRRKLRAALSQARPADDATLAEPPGDDH